MNTLEPSELIQQLQARVVELEQENVALQRSESRYRQCFENAPVSLLFVSAEGDPIEMNPAAEKFLGWTIAQAKEAGFNGFTDATLIENGTVDSFQSAIAGETVIEPPMSFDPSSTIGQGQWKWAQGHYYPIRDQTGQVQEVVEIALDLTPMYEVQQGLAAERDRAIQQQLADLAAQNDRLKSRDRLLEANAAAAQALLTTENLNEAVNAALQMIGEALEVDRACLIENFECPSEPLPCWRLLHEWISSSTVSQFAHPDLVCGTYQEIEAIYEPMSRGQGFSGLLEELPEPFRSGQASLGVKALHTIPIFVEDQFWGVIGFDDCREAKHRSNAELAILKTAATCIGSLIQRDRAIQFHITELETQNRLLESRDRLLESTAEAANALLTIDNFEQAVNTALQLLAEGSGCDRINILENFFSAPSIQPAYYTVVYEWAKPGIIRQMSHLESGRISNQGIEAFIEQHFVQGDGFGGLVDEWDEPLRSAFKAVQIQSSYSVPIRVRGQWWGVICFDYCRSPIRVSPAEVAVLRTIASCLGSQIERQAKDESLRKSEALYRTLFELSSEGISRTEFDEPIPISLPIEEQVERCYRHLYIAEVNTTFAAMYGYEEPKEMIGFRMPHIHVADSERNKALMRAQIENGYRFRSIESEEVDRNGRKLYFLNSGIGTIEEDCVVGGWGIQTDITELREAQQALLQAEQNRGAQLAKANITLKKTLDVLATEPQLDRALGHVLQVTTEQIGSSSAALWLYHPDLDQFRLHLVYLEGNIIAAIPETAHRLTGQWIRGQNLSGDLALKQHIRDRAPVIYDVDHCAEMTPPVRRFMNQLGVKTLLGIPLLLGAEIVGSFTIRFRDRRELQVEELELTQALAHQATLAIQLLRMAEAAKAEAQQTTLLEERNRMARELHDTLAQTFTGVIVQLEAAQEMIATTPAPVQKHLTHAGFLARQGLQEARRSVWSLRPEALETHDLHTAMLRIVQQMTDYTAIATEVVVDGTPIALPDEIESHLLRIGQESLTNILKHAQAQHIQLTLQFTSDSIALHIVDDGQGFDPRQPRRGFGITSMQQRTQQSGGAFTLTSQIGQGTAIEVKIPVVS
jgi:two-component system, NarL family, nitrate/nitrite sensor histidine kinase NarX